MVQKNDDDGTANGPRGGRKNDDKKTHRAAAAAVATLRTERAGPCDVALSANAPPALV